VQHHRSQVRGACHPGRRRQRHQHPSHCLVLRQRHQHGNIYSTSCSATLSVAGNGFAAYGITIENSFDPAAHPGTSAQAVAVKTVADRVVYANDRLLGGQDTVYASSYADPRTPEECFAPGGPPPATVPPGSANPPPTRQLYTHDYITGDVDFLFGSATAVFDHDTINILGHPGGTVSAPDTPLSRPYGLLITRSDIINSAGNLAAGSYYLARPWPHTGVTAPVGQITVRNTYLPAAISAQQWLSWSSPPFPWQDARFYEYLNTGPGATDVAAGVPQLARAGRPVHGRPVPARLAPAHVAAGDRGRAPRISDRPDALLQRLPDTFTNTVRGQVARGLRYHLTQAAAHP
jgi:pectin methylesterase-like acyl-CoA thioesterase